MVPVPVLTKVLNELRHELQRRTDKHGPLCFIGPHETLGILDEEFDELRDAVRANDSEEERKELMDIAVGAVFGVASRDVREVTVAAPAASERSPV
jgi:hypothetical protein